MADPVGCVWKVESENDEPLLKSFRVVFRSGDDHLLCRIFPCGRFLLLLPDHPSIP